MSEQITTAEELNELPVGSVLECPGWPVSIIWQKRDRHYWRSTAFGVMSTERMAEYEPFAQPLHLADPSTLARAKAEALREAADALDESYGSAGTPRESQTQWEHTAEDMLAMLRERAARIALGTA